MLTTTELLHENRKKMQNNKTFTKQHLTTKMSSCTKSPKYS